MSRYTAYPEYKDSNFPWMGMIPQHWGVTKISWNFSALKGRNAQMLTKEYCGGNPGPYPVFSGQTENDGVMGLIDTYEFDAGNEGVLFSTTVGAKAMHLSHLLGKFSLSQNCMIISPKNNESVIRFSFYHFQPLFAYERSMIPEHMQASFRMEDLYQYQIARPPIEEQQKIACFLDHETAKIDTLIAKQQELIKLLKEKLQAVISHAVTKGLNHNAPMRDSGVEWLGEVPAHWEIKRFKYLCDQIIAGPFGSSITKDMYIKEGFKVYGQEQVIPNDFSIGDYYISERDYLELSRYVVKAGDILISCVGTFGKVAVFPEDGEPGIINPRLIKAEVNKNFDPYYLREFLKSEMVFKQFELLSRGGTMGVINIAILNEIIASVPPIGEQKEIFNYIKEQESKFNHLIACAYQQIELSQERRTALISAAVTGKIDTRDWQPPSDVAIAA